MKKENIVIRRAMDYVNQLLIPLENHYYHQYSHALEVMDRAMYLAEKEGLTDDEIEMIGIASLFHDTGFVIQYDNNEPIGAKIAQNYLKSMLYDKDKIKQIEDMILATDPDYSNPTNIYEKIIMDSDLDNFGREDFFDKMEKIHKEREAIKNIRLRDPGWKH
jgi:predicted metal-dependent HD superfamily phosphohydrolase